MNHKYTITKVQFWGHEEWVGKDNIASATTRYKLQIFLFPFSRFYYGEKHPTYGLFLLKLGKIELYNMECTLALQHLKEAEEILEAGLGSNHPLVFHELAWLTIQASEETSVRIQRTLMFGSNSRVLLATPSPPPPCDTDPDTASDPAPVPAPSTPAQTSVKGQKHKAVHAQARGRS